MVRFRYRPNTVQLYIIQAVQSGIKSVPGQYRDVCRVHHIPKGSIFTIISVLQRTIKDLYFPAYAVNYSPIILDNVFKKTFKGGY